MNNGKHPGTKKNDRTARIPARDVLPVKLTRPRLHRAYRRQRLLRELKDALAHSMVWIAAGPGSGKTVLVSSYVASRKHPCLWYRIDDRDRDPATLFHYLRQAALAAAPHKAQALPQLTPEYLTGLERYARNFFERLFACLEPGSILVLDNCHDLGADSITASLLAAGVQRAPASLDVIMISRSGPGAPFARLRANESMRIIEGSALNLDLDEAKQIARMRFPETITLERVQEIHHQTRGWAAGFTLLMEQTHTQRHTPMPSTGQLFDYFAAEVLSGFEPAVLETLLQSAWLPRMPAHMLIDQCEDPQASDRIAALCRRNYFVSESGDEPVYEFHPLFRDCLLQYARDNWSAEHLDRVRGRAARLLAADAGYEDALELLLELGAWHDAGDLIVTHAPAWLADGRMQIAESALSSMPEHEIAARPWLIYWQASCRLPFDLAQARALFTQADQGFRETADSAGQLLACTAILESYFHERGRLHPLDDWIARIEALLAGNPQLLDDPQIEARLTAAMFATFMARQPGNPNFRPWIARAEKLIIHSGDGLLKLGLATHLVAYYSWWTGDSVRAKAIVDVIGPMRQDPATNPLSHIVWSGASAINQWSLLDFTGCIENTQRGLRIAEDSGIHLWDFLLLAQCTWGAIFAGEEVQAEAFLARMAAALQPGHYLDASQYHFQRFILALRHNDKAAMNVQSDTALTHAMSAGDPWAEGLCLVARARAITADGDLSTARQLLSEAEDKVKGEAGNTITYAVLLARAEWAFNAGDPSAGLQELRKLMQFARQKNIVYSNWERDEVMADLCVRALEHDIETGFVRHLTRLRRLVPREPPLHLNNWPWPVDVITLGSFEVRVNGERLHFEGKSQKRPLALLKALIAMGGHDVPESRIADALWPDAEGDAAQQSLATTLHRLRQLIGSDAVQRHEGVLSLDPAICRTDLWTVQQQLDHIESALPNRTDIAHAAVRSVLVLYRGPFLAGDTEAIWALPTRERMRNRLLQAVMATAKCLHADGAHASAITCYEQALQLDELAEQAWRGLMRCHLNDRDYAEGLAVYHRCAEALQRGLGVSPSDETETLRRALARH